MSCLEGLMTPQTVPGDDDGGLSQGLDDEELHGALGQVVHELCS